MDKLGFLKKKRTNLFKKIQIFIDLDPRANKKFFQEFLLVTSG